MPTIILILFSSFRGRRRIYGPMYMRRTDVQNTAFCSVWGVPIMRVNLLGCHRHESGSLILDG
jgi:hypothetical protein